MRISGIEIDVDIRSELEDFDERFNIIKERGNKFIACSPFRDEKHPSFAVNLENGSYIDSGSIDDEWRVGNFVKLLSFLREETYEETEDYLYKKYSLILDDIDNIELELNLDVQVNKKIYPLEALKPFSFKTNYLTGRNISEQVQRAFKIGYDPQSKAIVLPIMDKAGNIVSFKFRKTDTKIFWYDKEGQPIKQHLYGMHFVHQMNCKRVYIVEGEVDALYLWSLGIPAIATFGASLSKKQEQLILLSPIETLVIAGDNDGVGQEFASYVERTFTAHTQVERLVLPQKYKDVNEVPLLCEHLLKDTVNPTPLFL